MELTITDDDPEPVLSLSVDPDKISEARGESTVTVSTGDSTFADDQTITLKIESESTATETDDYTVSSKSLTLGGTQTAVTATVTAEEDLVYEGDETIVLTASHDGNTVGSAQTITIRENDPEPVLSIADARTVIEGVTASFEVTMAESAKTVTVQYTTTDGSAEQPGDYTSAGGTLTFTAGDDGEDDRGGDQDGRAGRGRRDVHGDAEQS